MEYLTPGWYWDPDIRNYIEYESKAEYRTADVWNHVTYENMAYSKVVDALKAQGYQYIGFGNHISTNRWDTYMGDSANQYFNYYTEGATLWISEFQEILWNTTMLRPFYWHLVGSQHETGHRRQTLYTLEHLKALPDVEGPKFVFAHFMCPHTPFVFGPEGESVPPVERNNYEDRQFYLGQYVFMSREMERLSDVLLSKSRTPPIIILQSDHGVRPHFTGIEIGPHEWRKILNAMYLPGMDYSEISESISPVNTFRLIFNHYFGADYEMLPDD